jgi:uroporphyrinogen decarboxylase
MNSRERIVAAARGLPTDRLPVAPYMGNHAAFVAGVKIRDYYEDPRRLAETQLAAWEVYRQDVLVAQSDNYYMAEGFGCKVRHHEDSTPTLERPALDDISEVDGLPQPDPAKDGRMHVYLDAIGFMAKAVKGTVAVRGCGSGPFVMAGHILGIEKLILLLADIHYGNGADAAAYDRLMTRVTDTLVRFSSMQLERGATIVQCADSLASIDVISPDMYRRYVWPYERRYFAEIRPICRRFDGVSLLHICGNNSKVFEQYADVGADIVAIDHKADLSEAKRIIGGKACLIGNVDPASVLRFGTAADVEAAVRTCIDKAAAGGRYILGTGCEVAIQTPQENIKTMIALAQGHEYR